jgi:transposase-like protein
METCLHCHKSEKQVRSGKTRAGSQRYKCQFYTPQPKIQGYHEEVRQQAVQFYLDGMNLRRIGRRLGIDHKTVSLWLKARAAQFQGPLA